MFLFGWEAIRSRNIARRMPGCCWRMKLRLHRNPEPAPERFLLQRRRLRRRAFRSLGHTRPRRRIKKARRNRKTLPWLGMPAAGCQRFHAASHENSRICNLNVICRAAFDVRMEIPVDDERLSNKWIARSCLLLGLAAPSFAWQADKPGQSSGFTWNRSPPKPGRKNSATT